MGWVRSHWHITCLPQWSRQDLDHEGQRLPYLHTSQDRATCSWFHRQGSVEFTACKTQQSPPMVWRAANKPHQGRMVPGRTWLRRVQEDARNYPDRYHNSRCWWATDPFKEPKFNQGSYGHSWEQEWKAVDQVRYTTTLAWYLTSPNLPTSLSTRLE